MSMTTKLQKWGNSYGVRVSKSTAKKYNIKEGSPLNFIEGENEIIYQLATRAKKTSREQKIAKLTLNFIERYRKDLTALADK